jgi:hypothetical protein
VTADADKREPAQGTDGDDLDSLVVPTPPTVARTMSASDDDIIDLRALSALSTSTRPGAADDQASEPSMRPKRARWLAPLVIGFLAGVPVGAWVFGGSGAPDPASTLPPAGAPVSMEAPAPREPAPATASAPAVHPVSAERVVAPPKPAAPARPVDAPVVGAPMQASAPPRSVASSATPAPAPAAPAPSAPAPVLQVTPAEDPDPIEAAFPERQVAAPSSERPRTMDTLLDDALEATGQKPLQLVASAPAAPAQSEVVPLAPSREDVSAAMTVLVPAIRGCAMGGAGMATAAIVVQGDGKVASVKVTGAPFEGASSGRCMEGVVRRAKFPRFRQPLFRVQFPFVIE